ncbi:hypothetical protein B0H13DRAFT_839374 [Mycena leptocephala]|nr:hypothetical protein B0H13DRAFT_839374 [Mycena leptocephala]
MGVTCSARRRNTIACSSSAARALIPHPSLLFRFFFLSPFPFPYSTFYLEADVPLSTNHLSSRPQHLPPAPLAARTRPARAPPLARYATLRPGRETLRISWRYWLGCVPPSFRFLSLLALLSFLRFPVIISSVSVLREVWRRDCAVIAACVIRLRDSSGRGWQR